MLETKYHCNQDSPSLDNLGCWYSILFSFDLNFGSRALHLGPRPLPNAELWSTVEVCLILSLWRKAGVEIQDFEYTGLGMLCIYETSCVPSIQCWVQAYPKGLTILHSSGLSNSELLA